MGATGATDATGATGAWTIRGARPDDAARLREIYAWYVENTAVSFEWEVPSVAEFRARIERTLGRYPYLVLEAGEGCADGRSGQVLGYAYAGPFKERAAYDWCVELSVYLDRDARGHGYGRALYQALEERLREMGVLNLYACITHARVEDEHQSNASEKFHAALGFRQVALFEECGYKFGRWYDMIWMEKIVGEHGENPRPVAWGMSRNTPSLSGHQRIPRSSR